MKQPTVSITVPIYNMEQYMRQCLDSIVAQTFTDWECWLIDDGSTDGSPAICDEYVARDHRFHVIHQPNAGVSAARQCGLDHSTGKYITQIDPDDWVDAQHIENMVVAVNQSGGVNLVNTAYLREVLGKKSMHVDNCPTGDTPLSMQRDLLTHKVHAGLWCKLIPRSVFTECGVTLPWYGFYEDMFVSVSALQFVERVIHVPQATYHYRFNPSSLSNGTDIRKRCRMDMEMVLNMLQLDTRYHFSEKPELKVAFDYTINFTKINALRAYYNHYAELKPMLSVFPHSQKLRYCHGLKDVLYLLAGRYGIIFPFRIYNLFKKNKSS